MSCHPGVHPSAHTLAVRAGAPEGSGGWARPLVGRGGLVTLFPSVTIASSLLHRQKYVVSDKLHGHPPRGSQTWRMSFCAPAKCMAQGCSGRTASGCCKPSKWPLPLAVPGGQGGTSPLPAARWPGPCSTAHPCVPGCGSWRTPPGPELPSCISVLLLRKLGPHLTGAVYTEGTSNRNPVTFFKPYQVWGEGGRGADFMNPWSAARTRANGKSGRVKKSPYKNNLLSHMCAAARKEILNCGLHLYTFLQMLLDTEPVECRHNLPIK